MKCSNCKKYIYSKKPIEEIIKEMKELTWENIQEENLHLLCKECYEWIKLVDWYKETTSDDYKDFKKLENNINKANSVEELFN